MGINKNSSPKIQQTRFIIQILFVMLCVWIGIEFHLFINFLESGSVDEFTSRPPGVDGFLPISSLMSVYYFILSGTINNSHPAGFFIILSILILSFLFGKAFCSWFCPIGFISETIADFSEKIQKKLFKKTLLLPRWLDYPLRAIKYLLFAFFAYAIFFKMSEAALKAFLDGPYNILSDVKMYLFFADISKLALIVVGVLFFLSLLIRNFWCRYLCPYGALLGILSILSPNKIMRNSESCIDCGKCSKACPSRIKVDKVTTIVSDECSTCLSCVDSCPVKSTLELKSTLTKKAINNKKIAIGIISVFVLGTGIGIISGNWQNNITRHQYLNLYKKVNSLGHPRSTQEIEKLNEKTNKIESKKKTNNNKSIKLFNSEGK